MKILRPNYEILTRINKESIYKKIEYIGRTAYKSRDKITKDSAERFINMIVKNEHLSVIEHSSLTIKFIVSRGFSHELVRHRLASFTQESTRYVNYAKGEDGNLILIAPTWFSNEDIMAINKEQLTNDDEKNEWAEFMSLAENTYLYFINHGFKAEAARDVLPTAIKTEIIVTANLREWKTILRLRTSNKAHPEMKYVMRLLLAELQEKLPEIFGDIKYKIHEYN